jgi:hypothetical protein
MKLRGKLESNDLIWEIQHRINVLTYMESTKLTTAVRKQVEIVLDQEREKLRRHVENTINK